MQKDNHSIVQNPFFIVGAMRSGTTLLRLMLDNHPRIAFAPEFHYTVSQVSMMEVFLKLASTINILTTMRCSNGVILM